MKVLLAPLVCALLATAMARDADACGDSLYRVGEGVSFREYTAPLPGNVLIYGASESARQLADALARSGHQVYLVKNELELDVELKVNEIDVIIAPYHDREIIEASYEPSETTFVPVATGKAEARQAEQSYSNVVRADRDEIKHYLKMIHRALRSARV